MTNETPARPSGLSWASDWVPDAQDLPTRVGSFIEDFEQLDVRRQKARLQEILKAAYV